MTKVVEDGVSSHAGPRDAKLERMFSFADLFAGIGGFHAALGQVYGGHATFASEWDDDARGVYEKNWCQRPSGNIVPLTEPKVLVDQHDVLAAGFPCQPFSKSGFQRGINETRGTLFFNIMSILTQDLERRPKVVLLENVRNLAGPRHRDTWATIVNQLMMAGYKVSSEPTVFSPHRLGPELGGRPQIRERVFITATLVGSEALARRMSPDTPLIDRDPIEGWNPQSWNLYETEVGPERLPVVRASPDSEASVQYRLSDADKRVVDIWADFVGRLRLAGVEKLPGFPIWTEYFDGRDPFDVDPEIPGWKADFIKKNRIFYEEHQATIDSWLEAHDYLRGVPASRRKFEWQAQNARQLADTVMHLRPSGLRVKRPTYLPALVAITQTSILGARGRRLTPREAARLQGLPDWFDFSTNDRDAATYKQLGNGVNVGAAAYVLRRHVEEDRKILEKIAPNVVEAVLSAPRNPDDRLASPATMGAHSQREVA